MRKTFKKVLCAVMAAAMVFATPVVAGAADDTAATTLTGGTDASAWTDWTGKAQKSSDYASKDGVAEIFVQGTSDNVDIGVEVTDGTNYVTTQTQAGGWVFPAENGTFSTTTSTTKGISNDLIKITAKAEKNSSDATKKDITITLYNVTKGAVNLEFKATGATFADSFNLHIFAIFGNVKVYGTVAPDGTKSASDGATAAPAATATPDANATTTNTTAATSTADDATDDTTAAKKTMKLSAVKVKKGTKKITGTVSVKKATVKIKVGNKAYKKATVKGKKFTLKTSKLKKGTKVTIKVTKSGYKTLTKTYKVK